MAIEQIYLDNPLWLRPGESIEAYNARIAQQRGDTQEELASTNKAINQQTVDAAKTSSPTTTTSEQKGPAFYRELKNSDTGQYYSLGPFYDEAEADRQVKEAMDELSSRGYNILDTGRTANKTGGAIPQPSDPSPVSNLTGDPEIDELAKNLPENVQQFISLMVDVLQGYKNEGLNFNPDIEIDDATIQRFMTQAQEEYAPYFKGEDKAVITDLTRALDRRIALINQAEEDLLRDFDNTYRKLGEASARQGITFSGTRQKAERELTEETNRSIARGREALQFDASGAALAAERAIGTEMLGGVSMPNIGRAPQVTTDGRTLTFGGSTPIAGVTGDIFGTNRQNQLAAERSRLTDLKSAERLRLLNLA